jgi:hypothetical protein
VLAVAFDDGARIIVQPDPDYEAWNVTGRHGMRIVCLPGGGLATWPADRDRTR